jgi:hypothetical protein
MEKIKYGEAIAIINESNTTYLLNFLIHGKGSKQLKELIKNELIERGALIK